jgi:hypothetical protein
MSIFKENQFFLFDQRREYEDEYSYTNESLNSFQLFPFQSGIIDFNAFQVPIPDLTAPLNYENNYKETSSKSDSSKPLLSKKKGRGRKRQIINSENIKVHDKFSTDNLLRKIQVHYLSFIIAFLNEILEQLNFNQKFFKLDYVFKKNVNMKFVESLKQKNIGEIICNKISSKYKKDNENANQKIYEEIKNNETLNNILSENYLQFFKKIYYKSNRIINLKEYGLDKDIFISNKVKLFEDLFKDNNASDNDKEYQKKINECAIQNYCKVQFIKK